ncbi:MAG: sulfatase-like hydrolase/transferase [Lentisphaeraceae bacterium]|nr:sulfatase-like hydrolase/transferase [Lentisphaeraceae bacterium]
MKTCFLAILFLLSVSLFSADKPNVIIIYTDDQGTLDMTAFGAKDLKTPYMDQLANEGIKWTQFYSAAPVCSPSRAALLTGLTPQAAGVPGNVGLTSEGMPSDRVTIAEQLKADGYKTANIGKWHLGHHENTVPNGQGFDYQFGHLVGCIDNYSHFFYWSGPNKHDLFRNNKEVHYPGKFFPDLMVEEATQFIKKNKKDPFFIYFAMNSPHYPYQGDEKWLEYYKDLPMERRYYAAFLSTQDERIGNLLKAVEEEGLKENTIIIFQSDHGHSTEQRAFFGGGYAGAYRGAKFSLLEGGIRVPATITWPGRIKPGVRNQMAVSCDWFPTILDLCGVKQPEHKLDGKSLVPIINSESAKTRHEFFNWQMAKQWVVREGDWKLCSDIVDTTGKKRVTEKGLKLYNITEDPSEKTDLSAKNKDVVERLKKRHQDWLKSLK